MNVIKNSSLFTVTMIIIPITREIQKQGGYKKMKTDKNVLGSRLRDSS